MLKGVTIGYSDLEEIEPSLGRARGRFRPGLGYELVQPVFQLFTQAVPTPGGDVADDDTLSRYHRSRDALGLSLQDDAGRTVKTTTIHIADYTHLNRGTIEVEALISDSGYWKKRSKD